MPSSRAPSGAWSRLGDAGHTVYLTEEEKAVEEDVLNGTIIGIGVTVDARNGSPTTVSVLEGSPASPRRSPAGRRDHRRGRPADGPFGTSRLVELVRGEVGTTGQAPHPGRRRHPARRVSLVREKVELPTVEWAMVPGSSVAAIRLNQFSQGAGKEVVAARVTRWRPTCPRRPSTPAATPVACSTSAVAVAGTSPEGTVYQSVDRSGTSTPRAVRGDAVVPDLPMAVLVDYGSASSAETVAAALR
ncbi:MAG: hypothetical protein U0869_02115 [Chloroflexota bacterium]